jgi:hypothetical protein
MKCASKILAFFVLAIVAQTAMVVYVPAQTPFYRAQPEELNGPPGTLIRQEHMSGAPLDATAYRVLYRSTGLNDEPIAVSGVIIIPAGLPPPGGRPIIAWAHPTSGVVPHCAPSLAIFFFQQVQGLREMIRRGYIVTATDYPGAERRGESGASFGRRSRASPFRSRLPISPAAPVMRMRFMTTARSMSYATYFGQHCGGASELP